MRRTGWKKTPDLSDKMDWQHVGESPVMTWTVKAIDRGILAWAYVFGAPIGIFLLLSMYFLFSGERLLAACLTFPIFLLTFLFVKVGMERTVFVYRATDQHLEVCQWQDIPDLVFTFLRVFPFIIVGIILMSVISNPGLSIAALVGPALVGILIASMGADSNYKKIYKDLEHREYRWDEVADALLDTHHGLIHLRWPYELPPDVAAQVDNPEQYNRQGAPLYFRADQQNQVIDLVSSKLPKGESWEPGRYKYDFSG
ncbi:hypothetical protein [Halopseudomonas pelagia]|uniref:hypothetical protein n=1 Tax=Halopseudomonas pelagia TaxID=553151 RepID=UPI0030DA7717|tara:strand:+ start:1349 stop:2116 length:768 start_codon:yes stop_codon:yes gene_type:complete